MARQGVSPRRMIHDTIIIGAGLAGLAAASRLGDAGRDVLVLEKSRGLGGRAATRRWDNLPVDHGAQFFTAHSPEFLEQVGKWLEAGICHPWASGFHQHLAGRLAPPSDDGHPCFACRLGMSSLGRALADAGSIVVKRQTKVVSVNAADGWILTDENGRSFRSRRLIVTAPPPQGAILLQGDAPEAVELLRSFQLQPCLAVAARYPRRPLPWQGIQSDSAEISWIGHDTSKRPDLHPGETVVVVHASPGFSRLHYDDAEEELVSTLLARASVVSGENLREPTGVFLHRWRYAMTETGPESGPAVLAAAPAPLVLAGEALAGGKIEGAWLSGLRAAQLAAQ